MIVTVFIPKFVLRVMFAVVALGVQTYLFVFDWIPYLDDY